MKNKPLTSQRVGKGNEDFPMWDWVHMKYVLSALKGLKEDTLARTKIVDEDLMPELSCASGVEGYKQALYDLQEFIDKWFPVGKKE